MVLAVRGVLALINVWVVRKDTYLFRVELYKEEMLGQLLCVRFVVNLVVFAGEKVGIVWIVFQVIN